MKLSDLLVEGNLPDNEGEGFEADRLQVGFRNSAELPSLKASGGTPVSGLRRMTGEFSSMDDTLRASNCSGLLTEAPSGDDEPLYEYEDDTTISAGDGGTAVLRTSGDRERFDNNGTLIVRRDAQVELSGCFSPLVTLAGALGLKEELRRLLESLDTK